MCFKVKIGITVPGYQGFEGDCNGHDLRFLLHSSIQDCAASCNDDDVCVGFVYIIKITAIYDCYLKSDTCATPTILYDLELSMYYKQTNGNVQRATCSQVIWWLIKECVVWGVIQSFGTPNNPQGENNLHA